MDPFSFRVSCNWANVFCASSSVAKTLVPSAVHSVSRSPWSHNRRLSVSLVEMFSDSMYK